MSLAELAARMNADTVRAQQQEIRRLRRALSRIAIGRLKGLRAALEYERIARETLAK